MLGIYVLVIPSGLLEVGLIRDQVVEIHSSGLTTSHSVVPANAAKSSGLLKTRHILQCGNERQILENTGYSTMLARLQLRL